MAKKQKKYSVDEERLDRLTATIVNELGEVDLYHYNKYAYLFEYFYIKNFGERFTGEWFIKQVHGPVIPEYKKQISSLVADGILNVDLNLLWKNREVDSDDKERVPIRKTNKTDSLKLEAGPAYALLKQIIQKFSKLSDKALEDFVYETPPVVNYQAEVESGWKQPVCGYVLDKGLGINSFKTAKAKGRVLASRHLAAYPKVNLEQRKAFEKEFSALEHLRAK